VYLTALGSGAVIVDKFGGAEEENPVERSGTGFSSKKDVTSESKARPGQRRPAAEENEC
jgi:hypothetical protein